MRLLALDTATELCSVALQNGNEVTYRDAFAPRSHTELILPMVNELLIESGLELKQMDALVFDRGPGAFTGVRIATSVVQGLAFGGALPVIGISSLAALAQGAYRHEGVHEVLAAIDARMGELYWGCYQWDGQGMQLQGEERVSPPEAIFTPGEGRYFGAGSGWGSYATQLMDNARIKVDDYVGDRYPHARDLLPLAQPAYAHQDWCEPIAIAPQYIRNDVVVKK